MSVSTTVSINSSMNLLTNLYQVRGFFQYITMLFSDVEINDYVLTNISLKTRNYDPYLVCAVLLEHRILFTV